MTTLASISHRIYTCKKKACDVRRHLHLFTRPELHSRYHTRIVGKKAFTAADFDALAAHTHGPDHHVFNFVAYEEAVRRAAQFFDRVHSII